MIISWNINSITTRLNHLISILKKYRPYIVLLQEIRCNDHVFPYKELANAGYNVVTSCQKAYNGVAILSNLPLYDVKISFQVEEKQEARYIEATTIIQGIRCKVISVYIPHGTCLNSSKFLYKIKFYTQFYKKINCLLNNQENILIGGDFNVAQEPLDVYDASTLQDKIVFSIQERKSFRKILNLGLIDIFRELHYKIQKFSWWDYRASSWQHNKGMRIDYILVSPIIADIISKAGILTSIREWSKPSDHVPTYVMIDR